MPSVQRQVGANDEKDKLICRFDRLAYDIKDGIPVLIESKATVMTLDEVDATR